MSNTGREPAMTGESQTQIIAAGSQPLKFVPGLTIDSPWSKDLDDAVWLERAEGTTTVIISISDVAEAVAPESAIDAAARASAATRYFAKRSRPMLPRELAEESLSLLPGVVRPVICIRVTLDNVTLKTVGVSLERAQLKSLTRFSYRKVAHLVSLEAEADSDGGKNLRPHQIKRRARVRQMLREMAELALKLLARRRSRGALALYDINNGWALTEEGQVRKLERTETNIGYIIVQELMVLANQAVAEHLAQKQLPFLYRNHRARAGSREEGREELTRLIEAAFLHPDVEHLGLLAQRVNTNLERARYGPEAEGHFGLNLRNYTHFTSPIRRYADLVNHRVVRALINKEPPPYTPAELLEIAEQINGANDLEIDRRRRNEVQRKTEARRRAAGEALASGTEALSAAAPKVFYQALSMTEAAEAPKEAGERASEPSEPAGDATAGHDGRSLFEAIEERIERDTLSPKEAYAILFGSPEEDERWRGARRSVLKWLAGNLPHAVSILNIAASIGQWPPPRYSCTPGDSGYQALAHLSRPSGELEATSQASTKKIAQQLAALKVCYMVAGEPLPDSFEESTVNRLAIEKKPSASGTFLDFDGLRPQMEAGDYASALNQLVMKAGLGTPAFEAFGRGPSHMPTFIASVTLAYKGSLWRTEGRGRTKKDARQEAAKAMLEKLEQDQKTARD